MDFISRSIIEHAISEIKEDFDSHDLIFWIMKHRPKEYIQELNTDSYINSSEPFKQLHATIGMNLTHYSSITPMGKVTSANLFGNMSSNESWRKT